MAIGLALTMTPLAAANLTSVDPDRSGVAAAMQNAVGRTSALSAVACVGLIANGMLTDSSFARLLHVAARLTRGQRRCWLRVQRSWPWAPELAAAFRRLAMLPVPTG